MQVIEFNNKNFLRFARCGYTELYFSTENENILLKKEEQNFLLNSELPRAQITNYFICEASLCFFFML